MAISVHDERVRKALFDLGYKNQVTAIAASFLLPSIIAVSYYSRLPKPQLWWWLGLMFLAGAMVAANRLLTARFIRHKEIDREFVERWRRSYFFLVSFIGFSWGNVGLLFVPENATQNVVLILIFLGVGAGASSTAGMHHLKGMYAGTAIGIFIQLLYLPHAFGEHALPLQMIMLLYMLVLFFVGRNVNRLVLDSILLRFENEEVLQQKMQEAARADRANHDKSMFLAAASHDLRQPVHALLLFVAALHQRIRDARQLELVGHIQKAGQTIANLFNALMELSRLESGSEKIELADVSVRDLLQQTVERQRPQAEHKGLKLDARAMRVADDMMVRTDIVLLGRIADNLISNAIRYTQHGRILVSLRLRRPDVLWLEIWDTGVGISADSLPKIFDPYFQVANAERDRSKGLGLGLAIVRKTADLLGYQIEVCSRPGKGTRFRLVLPGAWTARHHPQWQDADQLHAHDLTGRRLLLIDDDTMVLEAMRILLSSWNADLRLARDGNECRSLLAEEDWVPDCVLCDYRLPGTENGIDLLNMLVDRYPDVVAILQTGELDPKLRDMAEDAGYIVLTKPIAVGLLASTLAAVLPN
ncbi:MAG: hybrid sensor histidine kinase/response regulator [Burkholderiales bacterium]|nr:hybrid sensor histidine kinase/response regulator [Burkholderiales bacterium]